MGGLSHRWSWSICGEATLDQLGGGAMTGSVATPIMITSVVLAVASACQLGIQVGPDLAQFWPFWS